MATIHFMIGDASWRIYSCWDGFVSAGIGAFAWMMSNWWLAHLILVVVGPYFEAGAFVPTQQKTSFNCTMVVLLVRGKIGPTSYVLIFLGLTLWPYFVIAILNATFSYRLLMCCVSVISALSVCFYFLCEVVV